GIVRSRGGGGGLWASAGWLVAAGLATLLFTHHSFHRPLALGWGLSGVLALTCFGLVLYVTYLRSQLNRMRAGGLPDGSDYADFATGGPKSATRPQD
nr:hypothetical protein [Gemmatimonadota bacterium]